MGKQKGKNLTKRGLPKPLRRRGCERKQWDRRRLTTALRRRGCACRDTCFLMRGKGFGAVWVVEGTEVVRRNAVFNL